MITNVTIEVTRDDVIHLYSLQSDKGIEAYDMDAVAEWLTNFSMGHIVPMKRKLEDDTDEVTIDEGIPDIDETQAIDPSSFARTDEIVPKDKDYWGNED